jgi:hypothetical protein
MTNGTDSDKEPSETPDGPASDPREPVPLPPDQPSPKAPVEEPGPDPPAAGDPKPNEPTRLV